MNVETMSGLHSTRKDECSQTERYMPGSGIWTQGHPLEPGDPPLLQQQLQTSESGIQQIIDCFCSGTPQLRHILLKEVNTIFECRVCRSLFRGLPNLVAHKEFYCHSQLETNDPSQEDSQSQTIKELLEQIHVQKSRPDYVLKLQPIEGNQNAVFQFLDKENLSQQEQHAGMDQEQQVEELLGEQDEVMREEPTPVRVKVEGEEAEEGEESANEVEGTAIACCFCRKDFASRRGLRRHCRRMHLQQLQELCKFTDMRTVPFNMLLLSDGQSGDEENKPLPPMAEQPAVVFRCEMCESAFSSQELVREHLHVEHGVAPSNGNPALENGTQFPPVATPPNPKLLVGFDFMQLYCKLCKRQFSTKQNLDRHIALHTDGGSEVYIKFFSCPQCSYESRRKRDVIRHLAVVHKKSASYLARITARLESRAVRKPAEDVLRGTDRRTPVAVSPLSPEILPTHRFGTRAATRREGRSTRSKAFLCLQVFSSHSACELASSKVYFYL